MIRGPVEYVPPVEVEVLAVRSAIPLDENEGVYVKNIKTGRVRAVIGETYMLTEDEELWAKELPAHIESILHQSNLVQSPTVGHQQVRDKTRVVTYRVPHNSAVMIYDYKKKKSRSVFGPDLVLLAPEESFTHMTLQNVVFGSIGAVFIQSFGKLIQHGVLILAAIVLLYIVRYVLAHGLPGFK